RRTAGAVLARLPLSRRHALRRGGDREPLLPRRRRGLGGAGPRLRRRTAEPAVSDGGGLGDLLARRGYRDLLAGQTVSGLGDWMAMVALMALVLDITGSSTAVGAVLVLRLTPTVLAGPLATRLVARWDARRTMMAMDAARAGIVVLIPFVGAIWWVYLWAFLLEVGGLVFLPARDAAIPRLTGDGDLSLANGLILGSSYGTIPLGAGAFGAV